MPESADDYQDIYDQVLKVISEVKTLMTMKAHLDYIGHVVPVNFSIKSEEFLTMCNDWCTNHKEKFV